MADNCLFCTRANLNVLYEGDRVLGVWDNFPVSPGHVLLIPKRHISTWFEAQKDEQQELIAAIEIARNAIESEHNPGSYNIGINVGEAAGQTSDCRSGDLQLQIRGGSLRQALPPLPQNPPIDIPPHSFPHIERAEEYAVIQGRAPHHDMAWEFGRRVSSRASHRNAVDCEPTAEIRKELQRYRVPAPRVKIQLATKYKIRSACHPALL